MTGEVDFLHVLYQCEVLPATNLGLAGLGVSASMQSRNDS